MSGAFHCFVLFLVLICREPLFYIPAGVFVGMGLLSWMRAAFSGAMMPGRILIWLGLPTLLALSNLAIGAVLQGAERPVGTWAIGVVTTLFLAQLPLAAWLCWRMERYWLGALMVCVAQFWLACLTTLLALIAIISTWY